MVKKKISIVIINWNGKNDTLPCLESVRQIDYPNYEIVVVDNGSSDDSVKAINSKFPEVVVLETGKNLGYAGGNNYGMRYALNNGADHILLLNNDTVVDPQLLNEFVSALQNVKGGGIFSAKIYYYSNPQRIWYAGATWDNQALGFHHDGHGEIDDADKYNSIKKTDYASGCAFFINGEVLTKIGFFDERFFLLFEETDFSYRAKRNGFECFYVPGAKVWHKVSVSFGGHTSPLYKYFMVRNRLLWAEKNAPLQIKYSVYKNAMLQLVKCLLPPRIRFRERLNTLSLQEGKGFIQGYMKAWHDKKTDALRLATYKGIRDYFIRRFGDCPESVRRLNKFDIL